MRLTQRTALPLFVERGFDAITVNEIAAKVGMAASTLYRHFDTKEDIVVWDEHDIDIDTALERELKRQSPLAALRTVFVDELGARYEDDLEFQLERVRYIYATRQIHAAALEADSQGRSELTDALAQFMSKKDRAAAPILAGAAMATLDVAIDQWQASSASTPLSLLIASGFDNLERLGELR